MKGILFMDIETVPVSRSRNTEWQIRFLASRHPEYELEKYTGELPKDDLWDQKAALYAETGKVVCVSFAYLTGEGNLRIKSLVSRHESKLLEQVAEVLNKFTVLCAHNGKSFDWPFLYRRYVINGLLVPRPIDVAGKKPWEVPHVDTMELWKHLSYRHNCGLSMLAEVFGLPDPKATMDGSDVADIYYGMFEKVEGELPFDAETEAFKRISEYCNGDALTLVHVYCKMKGLPLFTEKQIQYA